MTNILLGICVTLFTIQAINIIRGFKREDTQLQDAELRLGLNKAKAIVSEIVDKGGAAKTIDDKEVIIKVAEFFVKLSFDGMLLSISVGSPVPLEETNSKLLSKIRSTLKKGDSDPIEMIEALKELAIKHK